MNANAAQQVEENFAELFEEFIQTGESKEGDVVSGTVLRIENDIVIVDVPNLKSEGRIQLREFGARANELSRGDIIDVYVDRFDSNNGESVLSYEKAVRERAWEKLEKSYENGERVDGQIFGRVKGGFTVDLGGAIAFLPGSQVDIRPVRDIDPLMNVSQPFQILKMDRKRGNIVVSRRAILEESRAEARKEILANIHEGQTLEGMVKNITDYGAFIDLGGVDGLLHVTDISWKRINHPSEVLTLGQTVKVVVTKYNKDTQRISLGMKQLEENPWDNIADKFPIGRQLKGTVTNITDYGAFVELEGGIEGLVHVSEMSWTKKNVHPGKIVSTSQEVDVVVLDIESDKHRISLGMKQLEANPWQVFAETQKAGNVVEAEIRNITDFGLFLALEEGIDGLVHAGDLSWDKSPEEALKDYKKGDVVKAKVLEIDSEKERIALGIKQLSDDPLAETMSDLKKGKVVTVEVKAVKPEGLEVEFDGIAAFIKKGDLSRDRAEQRTDRFNTGDRVDALVTSSDKKSRKIGLSIKALELEEEKRAIAEYGSTDSGASLGDILGPAIGQNKGAEEKAEEKPKKVAAKKTTKKEEKAEEKAASDDAAKSDAE